MAHVRAQLRSAFAARLASISEVKSIVHARTVAFEESDLPALQIVTPNESIRPIDGSLLETDRTVDVDVLIHVLGNAGIDDTADAIAAQVETLIMGATGDPWDKLILHYPSSAEFALDEPGERTLAVLRTRFPVRLHATTPEQIGDP